MDILARKSARVGQDGDDRRACPARRKLYGKVGEDVRVGVGPWNSSFTARNKYV